MFDLLWQQITAIPVGQCVEPRQHSPDDFFYTRQIRIYSRSRWDHADQWSEQSTSIVGQQHIKGVIDDPAGAKLVQIASQQLALGGTPITRSQTELHEVCQIPYARLYRCSLPIDKRQFTRRDVVKEEHILWPQIAVRQGNGHVVGYGQDIHEGSLQPFGYLQDGFREIAPPLSSNSSLAAA